MSKLNRREFIGSVAGIGAGLFLNGCGGKSDSKATDFIARPPRFKKSDLVVATGESPAKINRAAVEELGGMGKLVRKGDFVVLKPNMSWNRPPEAAASTNPEVLAELIKMCKEAGAERILVVDNIIDRPAEAVVNFTGIGPAATRAGAETMAVQNESDYRSIDIPKGKMIKKDTIIKDLARADVFINVPIAKCHSATTVTLGMKNLMGCIWDRQAWHASSSLDQCIADYASAVRPDLTVLDANRVLLTNGPKGPGETKDVRKVVVGVDPVAVDAYGATLLGQEPGDIGHIKLAAGMGVGELDLKSLTIRSV